MEEDFLEASTGGGNMVENFICMKTASLSFQNPTSLKAVLEEVQAGDTAELKAKPVTRVSAPCGAGSDTAVG